MNSMSTGYNLIVLYATPLTAAAIIFRFLPSDVNLMTREDRSENDIS